MKNFLLMIQFFTRLPINIQLDVDEKDFSKGSIFFPLVGLIIGSINAFAYYMLSFIFNVSISIVLVMLINVLITGALHIDGLADTCDGIFSSRKKENMLEIMKDSRIGTNGSVAIFFDLILRILLLCSISKNSRILALVLASVISRTMLVFLCYISKYARPEGGMGNLFIGKVEIKNVLLTLFFSIALSCLFLKYFGIIIIVFCVIFSWLFSKYITSKLGGITGDILGAGNELCEIIIFAAFVVLKGCGL